MDKKGFAVPPPTNGLDTGVPFSSTATELAELAVPAPAGVSADAYSVPTPFTRLMGFMNAEPDVMLPLCDINGLEGVPPGVASPADGKFSDSGWPHLMVSEGRGGA
jgi:hypothetical protein